MKAIIPINTEIIILLIAKNIENIILTIAKISIYTVHTDHY